MVSLQEPAWKKRGSMRDGEGVRERERERIYCVAVRQTSVETEHPKNVPFHRDTFIIVDGLVAMFFCGDIQPPRESAVRTASYCPAIKMSGPLRILDENNSPDHFEVWTVDFSVPLDRSTSKHSTLHV